MQEASLFQRLRVSAEPSLTDWGFTQFCLDAAPLPHGNNLGQHHVVKVAFVPRAHHRGQVLELPAFIWQNYKYLFFLHDSKN